MTEANVFVSEVAWMGTENSSTDEWIELYNDSGEDVSLDGWILSILDKKDIVLSGTIGAQSFYLIERTDDDTVPNILANLVSSFGTGLSNSGETLVLLNSSSGEEDRVIGGENWVNIGGDNSTKETAQKKNGSWGTGISTPKAQNISGTTEIETVSGAQTPSQSPSSGSGTVYQDEFKIDPYNIVVKINAKKKVFVVGENAIFSASASGVPTKMFWTFGDGSSKEESFYSTNTTTEHVYDFPGEYLVSFEADRGEKVAFASIKITVIENPLVASLVSGGFSLKNNSNNEIDIFGWGIVSGLNKFTFPKNTIILPKKTLTISEKVVGFKPEQGAVLSYANGNIALVFSPNNPIFTQVSSIKPKIESVEEKEIEEEVVEEPKQVATAVASIEKNTTNIWFWFLLLCLVIAIPIIVINFLPKKVDEEIKIID